MGAYTVQAYPRGEGRLSDWKGRVLKGSLPREAPLKQGMFKVFVASPKFRTVPNAGFRCRGFGVFGARDSGPRDRDLSAARYCLDA